MTEFHELVLHTVENCCEDEDNHVEDDEECVTCWRCKEWTSQVRCKECDDLVFESVCCG